MAAFAVFYLTGLQNIDDTGLVKIKRFQLSPNRILALFFIIFGLIILIKPSQKPIQIPDENQKETSNWKLYKNDTFHFSFKYPDYLLSNFQVDTNIKSSKTLKNILNQNKAKGPKNPNVYNVFFEADAWKSDKPLEKFIKENLPETKNLESIKIKLEKIDGYRITNIDTKSDAFFEYNLLKNGNFIYNFAIISDEAILVKGNTPLLYNIISTVKFY